MSPVPHGSASRTRPPATRLALALALVAPSALARAQASRPSLPRQETAHFELTFAPGEIAGCPVKDPQRRIDLFAARLEALHDRVRDVLAAPDPKAARIAVAIVKDPEELRRLVATTTGLERQGLAARSPNACVIEHDAKIVRDDAMLHRLVVHQATHLLLTRIEPRGELAPSWGWLDEGIAHWFEADRCDGVCEHLCYLERAQPPLRFWNGRWRSAARELLERDRLPALADVLGREPIDMSPEQHATALALVDWLTQTSAPPLTHTTTRPMPVLAQLVRAAKADEDAKLALERCTGAALATLEARFRAWIQATYPRA